MARRPRSGIIATSVVALAVLLAVTAPVAAGESDPDPLSLLPGRGFTETVGIGQDIITVWVCDTLAPKNTTFTLQDIVDWGNTEIAPFFALASRGRYTTTFVAGGEFRISRVGTEADEPCLAEAIRRTSTANTMVMTRAVSGGGLGTGGEVVTTDGTEVSGASLTDQSRDTGRGFLVRGGSFGLPLVVAHEIGHTLWWPHSGSGVDDSAAEYDNQIDLMSGGGYVPGTVWDNGCLFGPIEKGACEIVHTLAINRYASGWVDVDEIVPVARSGMQVDLVGPEGAGNVLALVPTDDPLVYLTVEAKPAIGYDSVMPVSGVTVHRIDLTFPCDNGPPFCVGTARRQHPAVSAVDSDAHVIELGESLTVAGVDITVTAEIADGFTVDFDGEPAGCAMGPNPFVDLAATSFAFDDVGCIRILGITTGTSASTYAPAESVTREQMAAFLARLWRALGNECAATPTPFVDIGGSFAEDDVACIWDLEVTTGTSASTYAPAESVTREQMAAFLARLWRALDNPCSSEPTAFTDIDGSFAETDIACIFHLGITTGKSPSRYAPDDLVTREEMAAFLARFWTAAT